MLDSKIKPKFHLFGHAHDAYGIKKTKHTTFVNSALLNHNNELTYEPILLEIYLLWEHIGRKHPKLLDIKITQEFHNLIDHTKYALQDIIRINDVWSEAKVVWLYVTGQNWEYDQSK